MKEDLRTLGVDGQFWRDVRFRWIWNSDEWIDSVPLSQNIEKVEQSYVRERYLDGTSSLDVQAPACLPFVSFPRHCHPRCSQVSSPIVDPSHNVCDPFVLCVGFVFCWVTKTGQGS
ncbi:hypothetical protein RB195_022179 [Necator americanus]|uniref:Uncharacterized protein n=1 Tax=Necator americanus TaxID=51031 RepID=A0ABR1EE93_NECAM